MKQDFAEHLTKSFITFMDLNRTIDGLESYYLRNKSQLDVIKGTDETLYADIIEAFKSKKAKILTASNESNQRGKRYYFRPFRNVRVVCTKRYKRL